MSEVTKRLRGMLKRLTYKPNWKLTLNADADTVIIATTVPDATKTNDAFVTVVSAVRFSPEFAADDAMILSRLKHAIREQERHEMEEWLRLDGVPVDDPHPEVSKNAIRCTCEPPWSENPSCCNMHGNVSIYARPKF